MHRRVTSRIAALALAAAAAVAASMVIASPARAASPPSVKTLTSTVLLPSTGGTYKCTGTVTLTVVEKHITATFTESGCTSVVPTSLTVNDITVTGTGTEALSMALPVCGDWTATALLDRRILGTASGSQEPCGTQPVIITTVVPTTTTPTTTGETTTVPIVGTTVPGTTVPGNLPMTGSSDMPLLLAAGGLAIVGAAAVLATRRQEHQ